MRKKPKPKPDGCRWKVLWTLLLGFLLFGASNARAYSVTFVFDIPEAGLSYVQFFNDNLDPISVPMTGNKAVFNYTKQSGVFVAIPDVYDTKLTTSGADIESKDIVDHGSIIGDGLYYYRLEIKTDYSGATYTFTDQNSVEPDPDPAPGDESYVNLKFGGVDNAYKYVYLMNNDEYADDADKFYTTDENPTKWSYTFNKDGIAGVTLAAQKGYRISSITCSNSSLKNANQEEGGDYYIQDISGASGFSLAPATSPNYSGAWTIDFYNEKVSGATFNVTIEKASDPVYFNIETSDAVDAALKALEDQPQVAFDIYTINPKDISTRQNVNINGNSFTYYYTEGKPTQIQLALNNKLEPGTDYEIVVTSDLAEGSNTYTVANSNGVFGNPIVTINLYDGCINGVFTVRVQKVGEAAEPAEPVVATGTYDGTYAQEIDGVKTNYPYTFNYSISFTPGAAAARYAATQADEVTGTLSITGKFTWENGAPVGYVGGLSATVPGISGGTGNVDSQDQTINLTASFKEGETITINFSSAVANGLVEVPVTYTVGTEEVTTPEPEPEVVEFKSQTPTNESLVEIAADGTVSFTLEFTGDVTIEKATAGMRGNVQLAVEPASGAASSFTFTFPKAYIDDLLIGYVPGETEAWVFGNVYAKDAEGNYVGPDGKEYFDISYQLDVEIIYGVDFNVAVDKTAENQLNTFNVTPAEGFVSISAYENVEEPENFYEIRVTGANDFEAKAIGFEDGVVTFTPSIIESGSYTIFFPYHAFDVTKSEGTGVEGDEGTAPDAGDKVYNSMEKTYPFTVTIESGSTDQPSGNTLVLDDKKFYPQPNVEYTYTPTENGTLKVEVYEGGWGSTTSVYGGLYTSTGEWIQPTASMPVVTEEFSMYFGWAEYNLTAGQSYYWKWSKNSDANEYALLATFTESSTEPSGNTLVLDDKTFYPEAGVQYTYTPTENGTLTWTVYANGSESSTYVTGGLYTSAGQLLTPDGGNLQEAWSGTYQGSTASYNLKANESYYFQWTKNSDGSQEYVLYVTFTEGSDEPTPSGNVLPLEKNDFFPKANEKYTFEAPEDGNLKLTFSASVTLAGDAFFTEDGDAVKIAATDGKPSSMFQGWLEGVTYVEYAVTEGSSYYFMWNKNEGSDDYSVYAEMVEAPAPELPVWTSNPANNSDSEDFMDFLQVFWGYKELELNGENWKNIKATFNVMEEVPILSANIYDYSSEGVEGVEGSNTVYDNAALGLLFDVDPFSLGQTGSWKITIPANVVLVDVDGVKIPNEAITINFNRVTINWYDNNITVNPKPETDVYELGKITLTFPEDAEVSVNDVVNTFVRIDGGERIELSADNFEAKGNVVTVDISEYVDDYATYELTIADKVLNIFFDYTTWSNKDLTYTWNYVPVPLVVSEITPADNSIMGGAGTIYIDFDQEIYVNGELAPKNPSYVSLDVTKVKVTVNGNPQTLNGDGRQGSPYLRALNNTGTNEQNGGAEEFTVGQLQFDGGDMAFFFWKGDVEIVIPAGLVTNEAGGTNEEITLHYSLNNVVENTAITWTPDMDAAMYQDEAEVKATWNGYKNLSLIDNPTSSIYVRSTEEDATGDRKVVTPTIDNGSLVFNFKQLAPGEYELVIPEGTVSLGENTINGDAIYTFTIKPLPVYLGLADSGFPMQYDTANELVSNDKGKTFTGTFEIQAGQSFNIWWKSGAMGMDLQQGYQTGFLPLGPASDKEVKLTFTEKDENLSEALDLAMEGYFTLGNDQDLSLTFNLDMDTRKLSILNNTEIEESAPEFISVAIGATNTAFPTQKEDDVKLLPSAEDPNIYEGTIKIGKSKAFAFYTPDGTSYTATSTSTFCRLQWAFGSNKFEWPTDEDAIAQSHLSQNNTVKMYFSAFTDYPNSATTADVTIRVNWEEQTFAMTLAPYVAPAPEELYLFGTTGGYTGQARYSNMATLAKAADANVYTLENFEVPACGIFVPDGENKAPNGAPDYGFYFFLNDHKTSLTSGTRYLAPTAADEKDPNPAIIDLSSSDNTYTVTAVSSAAGGGSNFIALNPGLYNFTFNFDTKQFTAVLAEEYNQVTFKFEGEGLEKNAYTYVKAMSMFDSKELKFVDPEYLYSYNQMAGVSFAAAEGYQLKITCANAQPGEGVYTIDSQNMDGTINTVLGLYPGANDFVFTITVSEIPEEPSLIFDDFEMTFTKGSEDAVTVTVPVSLDIADPFDYKGFQFDITLPLNFKATAVTVNSGINLGQNGSATVVPYTKDVPANTYRVLAHFGTATAITDEIATLTISGVYNDQMVNEKEYDVTIQNTVIFSTAEGSDITDVKGYTGTVTVYIEIPAEEITFDKVELAAPSYTDKEGNVTEVTQGESVDMTITVKPAETTDDLEVSADNGATVTFDEETGTWNVDTSGVEVAEGEEVTVTVTAKAGDVTETYELTVKGVLLGDSNANGVVTVADVVTTANYIAEAAYDNFCFPNANVILTEVDGKQVINAQDLSATVNIVLNIWDGKRELNARRHANRSFSNDRLVADDFHAGQNVIGINLENTANYSVLQATIELPAGMKLNGVSAGPRAANHELVYNVADGKLNVVLFSYGNDSFTNGEGSLFNISVTADDNCGDLVMTNILAADASANGYELGSEGGMYTGTTGIDGIGAEEEGVRYFTVDGVEVVNPEKGQILIKVANGNAEKVLVK